MRKLFKLHLLLLIFFPFFIFANEDFAYPIINYDSYQGKDLLKRSLDLEFLKLSQNLVVQKNKTFCSIAAFVTVLNALAVSPPTPFQKFNQNNIFTADFTKMINKNELMKKGMTLDQAFQALKVFPVQVEMDYANQLTEDSFRNLMIESLKGNKRYIIINYLKSSIDQKGKGHFSCIAAYDKKTDRFLILDVARTQSPSVWVKTKFLFESVNTIDKTSKTFRGILIIEKT